ncbi:MAG: hypothetical protein M3135_04365 [Actinomycetota bacterium]|nr:hypothetical protein [Actinomycetota bacterium]
MGRCDVALAATGLLTSTWTLFPGTAFAVTLTVTETADTADGMCNSDSSLGEAVIAAQR